MTRIVSWLLFYAVLLSVFALLSAMSVLIGGCMAYGGDFRSCTATVVRGFLWT